MSDFAGLGLSENLLRAIAKIDFETPTPVQLAVIPRLLASRRDLVAQAQTGTGKTAAFGLPILQGIDPENNTPQALVLAPTRELCVQIGKDFARFAAFLPNIRTVTVYGGAPIEGQIRAIYRGAHIVVATPGRLNDLLRRRAVNLTGVARTVLDEADEMLKMGFQEDLETILSHVPDTAQTLLFSATMPPGVAEIAAKYMTDAEEVVIGRKNAGAEDVSHEYYVVHAHDRYAALRRLIDFHPDMYAIIFCRTRVETQEVAGMLMKDGYAAEPLHGDLSQAQRDQAMNRFRLRHIRLLVATDVAARGLDVDDLTHVVNFVLPDQPEVYTHRSGRTGRAGRTGVSLSIIHLREHYKIRQIENVLHRKLVRKPVPGGREVCGAQLRGLVQRLLDAKVDEAQIEPHLPAIEAMLDGMDRGTLIKHFVSLEFNRFLQQYSRAPDLNAGVEPRRDSQTGGDPGTRHRAADAGGLRGVCLRISIGRRDGLEPVEIIQAVNSVTRGRRVAIGRISMKDDFTIFEVDEAEAEAVAEALRGLEYGGQEVRVTMAGQGGMIETSGGHRRAEAPRGARRPHPAKPHSGKKNARPNAKKHRGRR